MQRLMLGSTCCVALLLGALVTSAVAQDITIAAILPLTGPTAETGLAEQQGVQFAAEEINAKGGIHGHKLRVNFDDNQGKADQSILAFNREVDLYDVPVVITGFSIPTLALAPMASRKKVLLINGAAQSDQLASASPYLFNTMPVIRDETEVLAHFLIRTLHKKTSAIIYENSVAGIDGRDDFGANFKKFGGQIVAEAPVQPGDTNFRPAIMQVAAARPDVVLMHIVATGVVPQYVEQIRQHQDFPPLVGTTFLTPAMVLPGSEGWYCTAIRGTLPPAIEQQIAARFGLKAVNVFTREYYNDMNIVATVAASLMDSNKPLSGANFRDELLRIKTFEGIARFTFNGNVAARSIDILQVQHGVSVKVAEGVVGEE